MVETVGYADAFTFYYSARPGTAAAELEDDLALDVKQLRFDTLVKLQQDTSSRIWAQDVGSVLTVLVEGESRDGAGHVCGRTAWNRLVKFKGGDELIGTIVPVLIVESNRSAQIGELVSNND